MVPCNNLYHGFISRNTSLRAHELKPCDNESGSNILFWTLMYKNVYLQTKGEEHGKEITY